VLPPREGDAAAFDARSGKHHVPALLQRHPETWRTTSTRHLGKRTRWSSRRALGLDDGVDAKATGLSSIGWRPQRSLRGDGLDISGRTTMRPTLDRAPSSVSPAPSMVGLVYVPTTIARSYRRISHGSLLNDTWRTILGTILDHLHPENPPPPRMCTTCVRARDNRLVMFVVPRWYGKPTNDTWITMSHERWSQCSKDPQPRVRCTS